MLKGIFVLEAPARYHIYFPLLLVFFLDWQVLAFLYWSAYFLFH